MPAAAAAATVPVSGRYDTEFAGVADKPGQFEIPAGISATGSTLHPSVESGSKVKLLVCL
jgi:hypothetical protein